MSGRKRVQVKIRLMRKSGLVFIRHGLSETNWQDIPEDQRRVLSRDECEERICLRENEQIVEISVDLPIFDHTIGRHIPSPSGWILDRHVPAGTRTSGLEQHM